MPKVTPKRSRPKTPDILRKGGPMQDQRRRTGRKAKHKQSKDADE
ncbi:MAG: hypothetical protein AAF578_10300 [Pseudomonadota bacterium]